MLTQEVRNKKIIIKSEHFPRMLKERKHLFPNCNRLAEMFDECRKAIRDPQIGIFIEDNREDSQSNYICVFIGNSGKKIALPCYINEEIVPLTVKDIELDISNPNWFVREYNNIAKIRGMTPMPLIFKIDKNY